MCILHEHCIWKKELGPELSGKRRWGWIAFGKLWVVFGHLVLLTETKAHLLSNILPVKLCVFEAWSHSLLRIKVEGRSRSSGEARGGHKGLCRRCCIKDRIRETQPEGRKQVVHINTRLKIDGLPVCFYQYPHTICRLPLTCCSADLN